MEDQDIFAGFEDSLIPVDTTLVNPQITEGIDIQKPEPTTFSEAMRDLRHDVIRGAIPEVVDVFKDLQTTVVPIGGYPMDEQGNREYESNTMKLLHNALTSFTEGLGTFGGNVVGLGEDVAEYTGLLDATPEEQAHFDKVFDNPAIEAVKSSMEEVRLRTSDSLSPEENEKRANESFLVSLTRPEYWTEEAAQGLGSFASFLPLGYGPAKLSMALIKNATTLGRGAQVAAKWGSAILGSYFMSAAEGLMESTETFRTQYKKTYDAFLKKFNEEHPEYTREELDVLANGKAVENASKAASFVFKANMNILVPSNGLELFIFTSPLKSAGKLALGAAINALSESGQESTQWGIGKFAEERYNPIDGEGTTWSERLPIPFVNEPMNVAAKGLWEGDKEVWSSAFIGGLLGGGATGVSAISEAGKYKKVEENIKDAVGETGNYTGLIRRYKDLFNYEVITDTDGNQTEQMMFDDNGLPSLREDKVKEHFGTIEHIGKLLQAAETSTDASTRELLHQEVLSLAIFSELEAGTNSDELMAVVDDLLKKTQAKGGSVTDIHGNKVSKKEFNANRRKQILDTIDSYYQAKYTVDMLSLPKEDTYAIFDRFSKSRSLRESIEAIDSKLKAVNETTEPAYIKALNVRKDRIQTLLAKIEAVGFRISDVDAIAYNQQRKFVSDMATRLIDKVHSLFLKAKAPTDAQLETVVNQIDTFLKQQEDFIAKEKNEKRKADLQKRYEKVKTIFENLKKDITSGTISKKIQETKEENKKLRENIDKSIGLGKDVEAIKSEISVSSFLSDTAKEYSLNYLDFASRKENAKKSREKANEEAENAAIIRNAVDEVVGAAATRLNKVLSEQGIKTDFIRGIEEKMSQITGQPFTLEFEDSTWKGKDTSGEDVSLSVDFQHKNFTVTKGDSYVIYNSKGEVQVEVFEDLATLINTFGANILQKISSVTGISLEELMDFKGVRVQKTPTKDKTDYTVFGFILLKNGTHLTVSGEGVTIARRSKNTDGFYPFEVGAKEEDLTPEVVAASDLIAVEAERVAIEAELYNIEEEDGELGDINLASEKEAIKTSFPTLAEYWEHGLHVPGDNVAYLSIKYINTESGKVTDQTGQVKYALALDPTKLVEGDTVTLRAAANADDVVMYDGAGKESTYGALKIGQTSEWKKENFPIEVVFEDTIVGYLHLPNWVIEATGGPQKEIDKESTQYKELEKLRNLREVLVTTSGEGAVSNGINLTSKVGFKGNGIINTANTFIPVSEALHSSSKITAFMNSANTADVSAVTSPFYFGEGTLDTVLGQNAIIEIPKTMLGYSNIIVVLVRVADKVLNKERIPRWKVLPVQRIKEDALRTSPLFAKMIKSLKQGFRDYLQDNLEDGFPKIDKFLKFFVREIRLSQTEKDEVRKIEEEDKEVSSPTDKLARITAILRNKISKHSGRHLHFVKTGNNVYFLRGIGADGSSYQLEYTETNSKGEKIQKKSDAVMISPSLYLAATKGGINKDLKARYDSFMNVIEQQFDAIDDFNISKEAVRKSQTMPLFEDGKFVHYPYLSIVDQLHTTNIRSLDIGNGKHSVVIQPIIQLELQETLDSIGKEVKKENLKSEKEALEALIPKTVKLSDDKRSYVDEEGNTYVRVTTFTKSFDFPNKKINDNYTVKQGTVYYNGEKVDNPEQLPNKSLILSHIKERMNRAAVEGETELNVYQEEYDDVLVKDLSPSASTQMKEGATRGTAIDNTLRDLFEGKLIGEVDQVKEALDKHAALAAVDNGTSTITFTPKAAAELIDVFNDLTDELVAKGLVYSANTNSLSGTINGVRVAGTVDILAYHPLSGTYYILDFKTSSLNRLTDKKYSPGYTKSDTLQLNTYRALLAQKLGVPESSIKLGVIPIMVKLSSGVITDINVSSTTPKDLANTIHIDNTRSIQELLSIKELEPIVLEETSDIERDDEDYAEGFEVIVDEDISEKIEEELPPLEPQVTQEEFKEDSLTEEETALLNLLEEAELTSDFFRQSIGGVLEDFEISYNDYLDDIPGDTTEEKFDYIQELYNKNDSLGINQDPLASLQSLSADRRKILAQELEDNDYYIGALEDREIQELLSDAYGFVLDRLLDTAESSKSYSSRFHEAFNAYMKELKDMYTSNMSSTDKKEAERLNKAISEKLRGLEKANESLTDFSIRLQVIKKTLLTYGITEDTLAQFIIDPTSIEAVANRFIPTKKASFISSASEYVSLNSVVSKREEYIKLLETSIQNLFTKLEETNYVFNKKLKHVFDNKDKVKKLLQHRLEAVKQQTIQNEEIDEDEYSEVEEVNGEDDTVIEENVSENENRWDTSPGEEDLKIKIPLFLRAKLSNIQEKVVLKDSQGGNTVKTKTNFLGRPSIMDFDGVYNSLKSILSEAPNSINEILLILETEKDVYPWLDQVIDLIKNGDVRFKAQFATNMPSHAMQMTGVKVATRKVKDEYTHEITIYNSNSNSAVSNVLKRWQENAVKSEVFEERNGVQYLNTLKLSALIDELLNIRSVITRKGVDPTQSVLNVLRPESIISESVGKNTLDKDKFIKGSIGEISKVFIKDTGKLHFTSATTFPPVSLEEFAKNNGSTVLHYITTSTDKKQRFDNNLRLDFSVAEDGDIIVRSTRIDIESQIKPEDISRLLNMVGVDMSALAVEKLVKQGVKNRKGQRIRFSSLFNSDALFGILITNLSGLVNKEVRDTGKLVEIDSTKPTTFIEDTIFRDLAILEVGNSRIIESIPSNFRESQKSLYTYVLHKMITDRVRYLQNELKKPEEERVIINELRNSIFTSDSLYLEMLLSEETNPLFEEFREKLYLDHTSLNVLKKKAVDYYHSKKLKDLNNIEQEIVNLAYYTNNTDSFTNQFEGKLKGYELRLAKYLLPKMADKDTEIAALGLAYKFKTKKEGKFSVSEDGHALAEKLYIERVVYPELKRIIHSHRNNPDFVKREYGLGGKIFNNTPHLNSVVLEGGLSLLGLIKEVSDSSANSEEAFDLLKKDLNPMFASSARATINDEVVSRLAAWSSGGVLQKDDKGKITSIQFIDEKYLDNFKSLKGPLAVAEALAFEFSVNSLLNASEQQMLLVGDLAQKFQLKDKVLTERLNKTIEGTGVLTLQEAKKISKLSYINSGKRFADLIAPGVKGMDNEREYFWYVPIQDIEGASYAISSISLVLDGLEFNQKDYKTYGPSYLENFPNSVDYLRIAATDGAEFGTWKEGLYIKAREGKLTPTQVETLKNAITQKKTLEEFTDEERELLNVLMVDEIHQPDKPVYTGQIFEPAITGEQSKQKGIMRELYVKSSIVYLIPQLTGGREIDKLRVFMEDLEKRLVVSDEKHPDFTSGNVRVPFKSAVKLGAKQETFKVFDENENVLDNLHEIFATDESFDEFLNTYAIKASRRNLRRQQDVPYKSAKPNASKNIRGSQSAKLLWSDILSFTMEGSKQNFDVQTDFNFRGASYNQKAIYRKYLGTYNKLYNEQKQNLLNKDLKINTYPTFEEAVELLEKNKITDRVETLEEAIHILRENEIPFHKEIDLAATVGENIKPLMDMLAKEASARGYSLSAKGVLKFKGKTVKDLRYPLWASANSDMFEALLNAVLSNRVHKIMFPGYSYVLTPDILSKKRKVKAVEGTTEVISKYKDQILWVSPEYSAMENIKGHHQVGDKVNLDQVILPSKFMDSDGILINFFEDFVEGVGNKWIKIEDDKMYLRTEKMDAKLLRMFGFRIPTSGLMSMGGLQVVGFLKPQVGDVVISSRDFIVRMGSDFDIDKLYSYMRNHYYNKNSEKLMSLDDRQAYMDYYMEMEKEKIVEDIRKKYTQRVKATTFDLSDKEVNSIVNRMIQNYLQPPIETPIYQPTFNAGPGGLVSDYNDGYRLEEMRAIVKEANKEDSKKAFGAAIVLFPPVEPDKYKGSAVKTRKELPEPTEDSTVVMLAIADNYKLTSLPENIKRQIYTLSKRGVKFIVADNPLTPINVGDKIFIDYLKSIEADFTVYGKNPAPQLNLEVNKEKASTAFLERMKSAYIKLDSEFEKKRLKDVLLDIHLSVMENPDRIIQSNILKALTTKLAENSASIIDEKVKEREAKEVTIGDNTYSYEGAFTPISVLFQTEERTAANSFKTGISVKSLNSTLHATIQQGAAESKEEIKLVELLKTPEGFYEKRDLQETLLGITTHGKLGRAKTLGVSENEEKVKDGDYYISFVNAEEQQTMLDGKKLDIAGRVNDTQLTFPYRRAMTLLGFYEIEISEGKTVRVADLVSMQPIILEFTRRVNLLRGQLVEYTPNVIKEVIGELTTELNIESTLSRLKNNETKVELLNTISKTYEEILNSSETDRALQLEVLKHFQTFNDIGTKLGSIQTTINTDSRRLDKSIFVNIEKAEEVTELNDTRIYSDERRFVAQGLEKTIGNIVKEELEANETIESKLEKLNKYAKDDLDRYHFFKSVKETEKGQLVTKYVFIKPYTINGLATLAVLGTGVNIYNTLFPYQSEQFEDVVKFFRNMRQHEGSITSKAGIRRMLWLEYKKHLLANSKVQRIFPDNASLADLASAFFFEGANKDGVLQNKKYYDISEDDDFNPMKALIEDKTINNLFQLYVKGYISRVSLRDIPAEYVDVPLELHGRNSETIPKSVAEALLTKKISAVAIPIEEDRDLQYIYIRGLNKELIRARIKDGSTQEITADTLKAQSKITGLKTTSLERMMGKYKIVSLEEIEGVPSQKLSQADMVDVDTVAEIFSGRNETFKLGDTTYPASKITGLLKKALFNSKSVENLLQEYRLPISTGTEELATSDHILRKLYEASFGQNTEVAKNLRKYLTIGELTPLSAKTANQRLMLRLKAIKALEGSNFTLEDEYKHLLEPQDYEQEAKRYFTKSLGVNIYNGTDLNVVYADFQNNKGLWRVGLNKPAVEGVEIVGAKTVPKAGQVYLSPTTQIAISKGLRILDSKDISKAIESPQFSTLDYFTINVNGVLYKVEKYSNEALTYEEMLKLEKPKVLFGDSFFDGKLTTGATNLDAWAVNNTEKTYLYKVSTFNLEDEYVALWEKYLKDKSEKLQNLRDRLKLPIGNRHITDRYYRPKELSPGKALARLLNKEFPLVEGAFDLFTDEFVTEEAIASASFATIQFSNNKNGKEVRDNKYIFLRNQVPKNLLDNALKRDPLKTKGDLYFYLQIVGEYYSYDKVLGQDGKGVDIIIVDTPQEALNQYNAYKEASPKGTKGISYNSRLDNYLFEVSAIDTERRKIFIDEYGIKRYETFRSIKSYEHDVEIILSTSDEYKALADMKFFLAVDGGITTVTDGENTKNYYIVDIKGDTFEDSLAIQSMLDFVKENSDNKFAFNFDVANYHTGIQGASNNYLFNLLSSFTIPNNMAIPEGVKNRVRNTSTETVKGNPVNFSEILEDIKVPDKSTKHKEVNKQFVQPNSDVVFQFIIEGQDLEQTDKVRSIKLLGKSEFFNKEETGFMSVTSPEVQAVLEKQATTMVEKIVGLKKKKVSIGVFSKDINQLRAEIKTSTTDKLSVFDFGGVTLQSYLDSLQEALMAKVINKLKAFNVSIESAISSGETGFEEAFIKGVSKNNNDQSISVNVISPKNFEHHIELVTDNINRNVITFKARYGVKTNPTKESLASYFKKVLDSKSSMIDKYIFLRERARWRFEMHSNGEESLILWENSIKSDKDDSFYLSYMKMFTDDSIISEVVEVDGKRTVQPILWNNEHMTVSSLAQYLALYTMLKSGAVQEAKSFAKFIPVEYLNIFGISDALKNIDLEDPRTLGRVENNVPEFIRKIFQTHPKYARKIPNQKEGDFKEYMENNDSGVIQLLNYFNMTEKNLSEAFQLGINDVAPQFVSIFDKEKRQWYLFERDNTGNTTDNVKYFKIENYHKSKVSKYNSDLDNPAKAIMGRVSKIVSLSSYGIDVNAKTVNQEQLLTRIALNSSNHYFRELATYYTNRKLAINYEISTETLKVNGKAAEGSASIVDKKAIIKLDLATIQEFEKSQSIENLERLLLHEIGHIDDISNLHTYFKRDKETKTILWTQLKDEAKNKEVGKELKELLIIFDELKIILNTPGSEKDILDKVVTRGHLTDFLEFLTELRTDKNFQEALASIKRPKNTTLLSKFRDAIFRLLSKIRNYLGIDSIPENSYLYQAMYHLETIREIHKSEITGEYLMPMFDYEGNRVTLVYKDLKITAIKDNNGNDIRIPDGVTFEEYRKKHLLKERQEKVAKVSPVVSIKTNSIKISSEYKISGELSNSPEKSPIILVVGFEKQEVNILQAKRKSVKLEEGKEFLDMYGIPREEYDRTSVIDINTLDPSESILTKIKKGSMNEVFIYIQEDHELTTEEINKMNAFLGIKDSLVLASVQQTSSVVQVSEFLRELGSKNADLFRALTEKGVINKKDCNGM